MMLNVVQSKRRFVLWNCNEKYEEMMLMLLLLLRLLMMMMMILLLLWLMEVSVKME